MKTMKTLEECTEQAVMNCVGFKKGERATVIYDHSAVRLAAAIGTKIELAGGFTSVHCMENYGLRPDDGVNSLVFPDAIKNSLKNADVSFFINGEIKPNEYGSFRQPMIDFIMEQKGLRHVHMIGISEVAFMSGMSMDYNELRAFTSRVRDLVKEAKMIRVTTPAGSDFIAEVGQYKWCVADGFPAPRKWVNLPDGEAFTATSNLYGKIVVDGVLGDSFAKKYGLLEDSPVTIRASHSRITSVECPKNKSIERDLSEYILTDENANRFGEFAVSTNLGIKGLIGNIIHDEKFPGVHVAVGDPIGEETGADWKSNVHCDMIMKKCNIYVGDMQIMADGRFLF